MLPPMLCVPHRTHSRRVASARYQSLASIFPSFRPSVFSPSGQKTLESWDEIFWVRDGDEKSELECRYFVVDVPLRFVASRSAQHYPQSPVSGREEKRREGVRKGYGAGREETEKEKDGKETEKRRKRTGERNGEGTCNGHSPVLRLYTRTSI